MADPTDRPLDLGVYAAGPSRGRTVTEAFAAALSLVWVAGVGAYLWASPVTEGGAAGVILSALLVFLPLALIWMAVTTARSVRALRDEAARLQVAVDALRHAYVLSQQAGQVARPGLDKRLEELVAAQRATEERLAMFVSRRDSALVQPSADRKAALATPQPTAAAVEQPTLALGTPADDLREPLSVADFVRALHFPENAEDRAGFRALRLALEDRHASRLIRAAQDVLTLLAQEGIYMDDLSPDRTRPEVWRRFAAGERGGAVAALGGIRDRAALALTTSRMREDPVFRDAAHHFLRSFDHTFQEFEKNATDTELAELGDTRTARAFMLFGRITGSFD